MTPGSPAIPAAFSVIPAKAGIHPSAREAMKQASMLTPPDPLTISPDAIEEAAKLFFILRGHSSRALSSQQIAELEAAYKLR